MKKEDARSLKPEAQEALRRRAVSAVRLGKKVSETAKLFGVSRQAVYNWLKQANRAGVRGLKSRKRGAPPRRRLAPLQAAQVVRTILERQPEQVKLPFSLWTREAVQRLIAAKHGVRVSVWTVGRYLQAWGFTPQKPVRRAYEQDPKAVKRWLEEEYPSIRALAKRQRAEIYWGDEMGLRSDHQAGRSYGRQGCTPVIIATGKRFGCSMISAITNRGKLRFLVFVGRFTAPRFVDFLRRLARDVRRCVFLIVDRHPVHKAASVKRWLTEHQDHLKLFYLPTYSPRLNPDEYLNNDVKSNSFSKRRPDDRQEMVSLVRGYLHKRQRQPGIVRSYFQAPPVLYAAF